MSEEVKIIQENLQSLRESRNERKITYVNDLKRHPEIYKPFLIIVALSIIQQFSGMSILRAYVVKIFNEVFHTAVDADQDVMKNVTCVNAGGDGSTSNEAYITAIIIGVVRLIASLVLSKLLRKHCRR